MGNFAVFTATEAGTYAIVSESDADFYEAIWNDGWGDYDYEEIELPYAFTLEAGESFVLNACSSEWGSTVEVTVVMSTATPAPTESETIALGDNEITLEAGETIALTMEFDGQAYGPLTADAGVKIGAWDAINGCVAEDATNEYLVKVASSYGATLTVYATAEVAGTYTFTLANYVAPVETTAMEGELTVPTAYGFAVPVTFTIATPGTYLIESWEDADNTEIKDSVWGMGDNTYSFTTTEENEQITLYISNGNWESATAVVDYAIRLVPPVSLTQAGGEIELTANADVLVNFTATTAGTYVVGSTNETIYGWFADDVDTSMLYMYPLVVVVADPAVPVQFFVHIDDMNYETVDVQFNVSIPEDIEITTGEYTDVTVIANISNTVIFTAPTAGEYKIDIETAATYFGIYDAEYDMISWEYSERFIVTATEDNQEIELYVRSEATQITFAVSAYTEDDKYPSEYVLVLDEFGYAEADVTLRANGTTNIVINGRGAYQLNWSLAGCDVDVIFNETSLNGTSIMFGGSTFGTIFTLNNNEDEDVSIYVYLTEAELVAGNTDVYLGAMGGNVLLSVFEEQNYVLSWDDENLGVTVADVSGDEPVVVEFTGNSVVLEAYTSYEVIFASKDGQARIATVNYALKAEELKVGTNTYAIGYDYVLYKLTAEVRGLYTLTCEDADVEIIDDPYSYYPYNPFNGGAQLEVGEYVHVYIKTNGEAGDVEITITREDLPVYINSDLNPVEFDIAENGSVLVETQYYVTAGKYIVTWDNAAVTMTIAGETVASGEAFVIADTFYGSGKFSATFSATEATTVTITLAEWAPTASKNFAGMTDTVEVPAGETVWVALAGPVSGKYTMAWDNQNVSVEIYGGASSSTGSILFTKDPMSQVLFGFTNNGAEDVTVNVTFAEAKLVVGNNTITITEADLMQGGSMWDFMAEVAGKYTFTVGANTTMNVGPSYYDLVCIPFDAESATFELSAGEMLIVIVITSDYELADVSFNIAVEPTCTNHSGGTATCTTLATCATCGKPYGQLNADNHVNAATYAPNGDGTHNVSYACCGATTENVACTGGEADCCAKAVCDVCGGAYGEKDADNHAITADEAEWTAGEGEYAGFDVKACACGHVYATLDVTNEKVTEINLGIKEVGGEATGSFSLIEVLDEKFLDGTVSANLSNVLYNGESVQEYVVDEENFTVSTAFFTKTYGRDYLSFIFVTSDEAEHEVKVYVELITNVIMSFDELLALAGTSSETRTTGYYVLGKDIGLESNVLASQPADKFTSITLDGNGHSVTFSTSYASRGLFGYFNGTIKDVTFNVYNYQDSYASAAISQNATGATFEDVTYNVLSKASNPVAYGQTGVMVYANVERSTFKNVTINTMGVAVGSIFGAKFGTEANGLANTFENVTVYATDYVELANTESSRDTATAIQEIAGVKVVKPVTLNIAAQEILLTASTYAISLGENYADATATSITFGAYDFGTNLSALQISAEFKADKQSHGEQLVTVKGTKANVPFIVNVPVIFVTMEIGDVATFKSTIVDAARSGIVYGYYKLSATIGKDSNAAGDSVVAAYQYTSSWDQASTPVGFRGTLDGQNNSVYYSGGEGCGLFHILRDATIKNVTLINRWFGGGGTSTLAFAMFNSKLENVTIEILRGNTAGASGTAVLVNSRLDTSSFKNVTISLNPDFAMPAATALVKTHFYADANHALGCTFENFVIEGFTVQYLGVAGSTYYVMEGQTVEGQTCVVVPGVRYATTQA